MGYLDEYQKALEEEKKKKKKQSAGGETGGTDSYMDTYRETLASLKEEEEIAPITRATKDEEEDKRKWFQKGAFEDGYQFGDILKTTTGTIKDVRENLIAGVLGIGEATVDAGAYIAGGVGKLLGADKFADKTKDFISKELVDEEKVAKAIVRGTSSPILDPTRKHDTDDISILGEKSDSLLQSGGQLLGTMGLQAAGVPWFVTSGVTSFGSEAENAFHQGAGYGEAGLSAAVSAGAEILTEKLFGGSGLGEKGLVNLEPLTKGISNKLAKALADHGVDMAAEGAEEVFSQVASNLGTALYKEENLGELLLSEEALDSYLESFIGGAALGGVANVGKVSNSIQTGQDYRTGLTEAEQKVFDKVYADAIAEAEQDGKKLTKNEKAKIYDEVVEQMEKGYISTDTIEEVLGGDTYKSYRDTVDSEDSILKEFEELGKKQNATLAEQARYNELSQQAKEIRENSKRNEFKTKLGEEVFSLVQNERLGESYAEQSRRGQAFAADLSKYDKKQQQTIQKAIDSGILNNTNRTHEFVDMVAKITADKGVPFDFTNNQKLKESGFAVDGKTVNGYVTKDGITVNINSSKSLNSIVGHEITHVLEGTDIYTELQSAIVEYAKSKGDYQGRYDSLSKLYQNIEGANIDAELTADLVGDYLFTDSDFVRNLSVKHRNVFQKIWDEVKYLAKVATAGSKEAKELAKVQRAFEKVYREGSKAKGDTKYSLSDSDGKQLTTEQQEYFKDSKMRDEKGNLKVMYHGSQDAGFHVFDAKMSDDDTSFFFVDRNDVAASYSGTTETYEAKTIRTAEDMNNFLAEIGQDEDYSVVEKDGQFILLYDGERVAASDTAPGIYKEFCWYEGVGEGDANYKVYLNLTNPLEVDAEGRNWNNVSREFSQEIYDRYQTLTEQEKDYLRQLASWEDVSIFRDEILDVVEGDATQEYEQAYVSAYNKLGGKDADLNNLFAVASEGFTEEAIRENAVKRMNTRDYAQRAKAEGYDGVIFKNIVDIGGYGGEYTPSTVAIAFDSNQIKSVANGEPTKDADIRYSLSDSEGNKLSNEQVEYFQNSKIRDADGNLKVMHHGSSEAFTVFDRKKAKSSGYYGSGFYFTDSDSHAKQYGNTYDVYLNITNPLQDGTKDITKDQLRKFVEAIAENEDYGIENYGYGATVDSVTDSVYGKSDFAMLMDINASCVGNMVEAIELFNEVNGTDYNGIVAATETVAFYPEQIKRTDNTNPTEDKDIRFSLSEPVEQTKELIALHNLNAGELLKSLDLGGLAMPSIAVVKADAGHDKYGDVSLVLPKEAIDPQANRDNKVYGGDAWTPVHPRIEYEVGDTYKIETLFENMLGSDIYHALRGSSYLDSDELAKEIGRSNGNIFDAVKRLGVVKYGYLQSIGQRPETGTKQKTLDGFGKYKNDQFMAVFDAVDGEAIRNADYNSRETLQKIADALNEHFVEQIPADKKESVFKMFAKKPLYTADNISIHPIKDAYEAWEAAGRTIPSEVDYHSLESALRYNRAVEEDADYQRWVEGIFDGIIKNSGIYNGKDYYTPSGNRRSWNATHWENTLENVVRAMKAQEQTGADAFAPTAKIMAVAQKQYGSIADIKSDSNRLGHIPEEEYTEMEKAYVSRFSSLAQSIKDPSERNPYIASDNAAELLVDAVSKYKTKSGMLQYLQKWNKRVTAETVDELVSIVNDIANMPTGYFEAKPQRAVGFDEVAVFVIPRNADVKLKQELLNRGYSIAEYDPDVEGDRQKVVNQFEEYKFSLSNIGEEHKKYGSWNVYGKDIRLNREAASEDIAPIANATVAENATVAPVSEVTEETVPEVESVGPVEVPSALYNKRDGEYGWGKAYATAQEALNDAVRTTDNALWDAFNAEIENTPQNKQLAAGSTPIINALIAVQEDVRQSTITPIQGAQLLSEAYKSGGVNALRGLYNPKTGNLWDRYLEKAKQYDTTDLFPASTPIESEIEQLQAEMDTLTEWFGESGYTTENAAEYQRKTERYLELEAKLKELEQERQTADEGRLESLTDAPPEVEAPYYAPREYVTASDPFAERDWYEVGNRKKKAYMYEHPEVKPFFQEMAGIISWDLSDTIKAERWYNDELHYASGGEKGFGGNKRHTSRQIETMLDEWGMSYADIEKGLNAIIEDNGAENIAAAKKIEFMLNDMLLNGYQDFHTGKMVEPNQEYIKLLNDMQITDYSKEAFDALMANADQYAPVADEVISKKETTTPLAKATPDTMDAPIYESKEKDAVKGQTTMFEPPKPNPKVANVLTEESEIKKEKSGIGSKLVSALVDKGMVFENLSLETGNMRLQSKYNYALPSNTEARAQYLMENGDKGVKSLKDIKARVEKSGKTDQFYDYLYHVHNIDRMTLADRFMDTPNKPVFGETVTAAESKKKVAEYERANPEFKAMAADVYAYNRHLRKMLADSGVISRKTAALWQKMYPHYVPIRRVDTQGQNISVPLDSKKTGVNNPVKRATGGSSDIMPLFETMAQRTEQTFRAIARNSFGIELKNTLGTTIGTQETNVDEVIDTIGAQEELLKPGTTTTQPTFTVFENGEKVEFEITEDMFNALKPADGILGYRNKVVQKVGDARRNLLTVWNPVFALYRNPIKDIQDVAINSQHPLKTYLNVPNAIFQMATNGEYATEYHKNGGKSNTYFDSRTNKFKAEDNLFKKIIGMPVRAIESAGEFIEEIPRLAEYIASRQEGRSVERSMLDAARVTTNFAAGGDFTKFLNSHGFTFLNASVQGASQHVRNFREAKQQGLKGYVKVLAKYAVAGLPTILLNGMLWDDDEEYEELSDYVKQNYYVVAKTEGGKFVRIPKGRTAAVMGELFQQMENLATGDDEADFSTFFELFMDNIAPNNPIDNNIIAPIAQTLKNNAWYGGDIVPSRLQDLPAEEQYDESTDSISKWLGEKTGTSPYKWNYLIDQYSGGLGDVFLPMLTPEAESGDNSIMGNILAPWKKEITTDKVLNNKYPGDFYDLKDELDKKANSSKATEEDTMRSMFMQSVSWDMSDLYKQKREIQSSDLSDAEKYEAVREIQEQINALAESGLNGYNDVSVMGLYAEVGDRRYNRDEENGKWYEIQETNSDGSANYYYEKEQEVTKALGISYEQYWNNREEYNYAYDKPEQYQLARAVGGYQAYRGYTSELWDISADKDENGKSISGSRKEKVIDYLNELDADYYTKIILFKNEYNADDTYNYEIIDYLNGREDISYEEMETILKYLGFEVDSDGNISW